MRLGYLLAVATGIASFVVESHPRSIAAPIIFFGSFAWVFGEGIAAHLYFRSKDPDGPGWGVSDPVFFGGVFAMLKEKVDKGQAGMVAAPQVSAAKFCGQCKRVEIDENMVNCIPCAAAKKAGATVRRQSLRDLFPKGDAASETTGDDATSMASEMAAPTPGLIDLFSARSGVVATTPTGSTKV